MKRVLRKIDVKNVFSLFTEKSSKEFFIYWLTIGNRSYQPVFTTKEKLMSFALERKIEKPLAIGVRDSIKWLQGVADKRVMKKFVEGNIRLIVDPHSTTTGRTCLQPAIGTLETIEGKPQAYIYSRKCNCP